MTKVKYTTRTRNVNVRLKEDEFQKLELKATEQKISVSEFVRKLLF